MEGGGKIDKIAKATNGTGAQISFNHVTVTFCVLEGQKDAHMLKHATDSRIDLFSRQVRLFTHDEVLV